MMAQASANARPIPFAGSSLRDYRHVCAFFSSSEEEYGTLLPFIRDGFTSGERAYHVLPAKYRDEHLDRLRGAGIDVEEAERKRQLEVALPEDTYLRGGRFSKDAMIELIQEALKAINTALADTPANVLKKMNALKKQKQEEANARREIESALNTLRSEKRQQDQKLAELQRNGEAVIGGVQFLRIWCLDVNGAPTAILGDVRSLRIRIGTESESGVAVRHERNQHALFDTRVRLRNL